MYMEDVDLGDRLGKAGWQNVYVPSAEFCTTRATPPAGTGLQAAHTRAPTLPRGSISERWQAPLRWTMKSALAARAGLVVRNPDVSRRKDGAE